MSILTGSDDNATLPAETVSSNSRRAASDRLAGKPAGPADRLGLVALVTGIAALFVYNFWLGERIQFNGGLGWDGAAYADWAQRDSVEILLGRAIPSYYIGRLLPSIIIHNAAAVLGIDISTTKRVIAAFYVYNAVLLVAATGLLWRIGVMARWSGPTFLVAVAGVFFNYAVLKNASYNPTLTDMSALFFAVLTLYAWVARLLWLFFAAALASAFVWPTNSYAMLPLLLFWETRRTSWGAEAQGSARLRKITAAAIATATAIVTIYLFFFEGFRLPSGTNPVRVQLLWLSVPALVMFHYCVLQPFADPKYALRAIRAVKIGYVLLAVALYVAVKLPVVAFSSPDPGPLKPLQYVFLVAQGGIVNPLANLVAHIGHYGPIIALAMLLWFRVAKSVRTAGPGMVALFALYGYLSMGTESRQFLPFLPVLVYFVAGEVEKLGIDWFTAWVFAAIALIVSRFWLQINVGPWTGEFLKFPDQMLYMYSGPWMSDQMYAVFLAVAILVVLAVAALVRPFLRFDKSAACYRSS